MTGSVPPMPSGWHKTTDDVIAEAKRRIPGSGEPRPFDLSVEMRWAADYEVSLLPADTRFPHEGDIYEAVEDTPVGYMIHWAAPVTGHGEANLRAGERLVVVAAPEDKPLSALLCGIDHHALEMKLVPADDLAHPKWGGMTLSIKTAALNTKFRLVGGARGVSNKRIERTP